MRRVEKVQLYVTLVTAQHAAGLNTARPAARRVHAVVRGLRLELGYNDPYPGQTLYEAIELAVFELAGALAGAANDNATPCPPTETEADDPELIEERILATVRRDPWLTKVGSILRRSRAGKGGHALFARMVQSGRIVRFGPCFRAGEP